MVMMANIEEKEEEVRKIWTANRNELSLGKIFLQLLGDYFDTSSPKKYIGTKDWLFFMRWAKKWKEEEAAERINQGMEEMTDEEISKVQDRNRRRMILMLREVLKKYETDPRRLSKIAIGEIRRLYQAVQTLEESKKRTAIAKGKLKLEAVRTLLPYHRMSLPELLELRKKLNESFDRIIKIKSGEGARQQLREATPSDG